ncbi:MAG: hypothetical protein AVO35_12705 [Candidatus Aegiribacteria sp. MLS_C]|nr:MAG: hypothetical protein AVO35_12705 [Candidatus Aegiribacteria sp. MLS_C]
MLYDVFQQELVEKKLKYKGNSVWFFPERDEGKERIFWHLTHIDDESSGQRIPDPDRASKLAWIEPLLSDPYQEGVLAWDYEEAKNTIHTYVWLVDWDYLIIMKKYPDETRRLITAHCILYPHKKRKLEKKYNNRIGK